MTDQLQRMSGYGHGQSEGPKEKVDTSPHVQHPPDAGEAWRTGEGRVIRLMKNYSISDLKIIEERMIEMRSRTSNQEVRDQFTKTIYLIDMEFNRRMGALLIT